MTRIEQLQTTGIARIGNPQRGFRYRRVGGKVSAGDLKRIRQLRIPPAWKSVAINATPGGKVQVVGKDAAGRWQYVYHESHTRAQEIKKFKRLMQFAEALPKLRSTVSRRCPGRPRWDGAPACATTIPQPQTALTRGWGKRTMLPHRTR